MKRAQRHAFVRKHLPGLVLLVLGYVMLMVYRDLRDSFMPDILRELGHAADSGTFARIESMVAVHDFTTSFGYLLDAETLAERQKQYPAVRHPVVRTHPETGRKILYVNPIFVSHLDGADPEEGARLLDLLYRQALVPEYQVRFRWQADSVAFLDNRSVQHYAASDYSPQRRIMERVAIVGDRPS